jgi:enoyl-CoA hydratase
MGAAAMLRAMADKIHSTMDGRVMRLKLDDGKANTIEARWVSELSAALDIAERDAGAVLLEGREGRFCAGLDLKVLPTLGRERLVTFVREYQRLMLRLFSFPRPVVCAIGGHAIAGGAILALVSDVRIMAEGTFHIGLREVAIGIPLPTFGCELAKATLPPTSWTGAVLRGELYVPSVAHTKGFVDRVVPAAALTDLALAEARAMAMLPDLAFAKTKVMLRAEFVERIEATGERDLAALSLGIPLD